MCGVLEGDSDPEPACQTIWHCSGSLYIQYFNDLGSSWLWQVSQPHDKDGLITKTSVHTNVHEYLKAGTAWRGVDEQGGK